LTLLEDNYRTLVMCQSSDGASRIESFNKTKWVS
jgi:hypothetical protein